MEEQAPVIRWLVVDSTLSVYFKRYPRKSKVGASGGNPKFGSLFKCPDCVYTGSSYYEMPKSGCFLITVARCRPKELPVRKCGYLLQH